MFVVYDFEVVYVVVGQELVGVVCLLVVFVVVEDDGVVGFDVQFVQ